MKRIFALLLFAMSLLPVYGQPSQPYQLSSHVLDLSRGIPAQDIVVSLYRYDFQKQDWEFVDKSRTDSGGRIYHFLPADQNNYGAYKLRFETEPYFRAQALDSIYPYIEVVFKIEDRDHYHIPITVSANGYSTYRGS
ncbi:MAG: hydroxyisourate hydrolase [Rikenellaceae bacterium]|nr:hydroxyisourate hydrolase [Rikenellaceae bacterium]